MEIDLSTLSCGTLHSLIIDLGNQVRSLNTELEDSYEARQNLNSKVEYLQDKVIERDNLIAECRLGKSEVTRKIAEDLLGHVNTLARHEEDYNSAVVRLCGLAAQVTGAKILAIKALREHTGMGLKEAKEAVEGWETYGEDEDAECS